MSTTASHLLWVDLESTDLPTAHDAVFDFSGVHILEVGVIITDTDLNILTELGGGYTEVIKMTPEAANSLRANEFVRKMHVESGLIKDSISATKTLDDVDSEIDAMLSEVGVEKGMVAIAGSGVAMFDFPAIKAKMPKTASWLAYYPYDWGVFRRCIASVAGKYVVNPHQASYGTSKLHRAFEDITAHLREAQRYRDWIRSLPQEEDPES